MTLGFPLLLTEVGNSEMNRPSPITLQFLFPKPHSQPVEGPKLPSGAPCISLFREQCPPETPSEMSYVTCLALRAACLWHGRSVCWAFVPVSLLEVEN